MNRKQKKERLKWLNHGQALAVEENRRVERMIAEQVQELQRQTHRREAIQRRWNSRKAQQASRRNNTPKTSMGEW